MQTPNQVVGERVRTIREARRLSQRELAARVQALGVRVHHPGIGKVEQGQRRLDVSELFAFAYALDVSPLHLMVPAEDDASGVAVTPDLILTKAGNLRRWMRGHVPLVGQDGMRYYEVANPPGTDFDTFTNATAAHNQVVDLADDLRDAVLRRDRAAIATFARDLIRRVRDVADDDLMTEREQQLFLDGANVHEGEDQ
jgi:transcriptional regulator with XRE-family HTH domain